MNKPKTFDVAIIGGGIIGTSTAFNLLKLKKLSIVFLEAEEKLAAHQTGNNSGVIHSGIYYKPGSLKAQNCVRGYKMMIDFCNKNEIRYDICGKVIVASSESEISAMENIMKRGIENGLNGLKRLRKEELKNYEPHIAGAAGIFVPQTGIIDYTKVSEKYLELIKKFGGAIEFGCELKNIRVGTDQCEVITSKGTFVSKLVATCTGLFSDRVAKMTHPHLQLRIIPFRGEYFKLKDQAKHLVKTLIYPVPDPNFPFLGVHFTKMIDGEVECGPNAVLSFKREGYTKTSFNLRDALETMIWPGFHKVIKKNWRMGMGEYYRSLVKNSFVKALQKMVPEIEGKDLVDGGAGVRAQACDKRGGLLDDFYIVEDTRVVHVCNAPSPAATASLSIGDYVSDKVIEKL